MTTSYTYLTRYDLGLPPIGEDYQGPAGAYPKEINPEQVTGLVIHHTAAVWPYDYDHDGTAGDRDDIKIRLHRLRQVRARDLGTEVPYSFLIFPGSTPHHAYIAEGRGFGRRGAHTRGYNTTRYGVAFAGNTDRRQITAGEIAAVGAIGNSLTAPRLDPTTGHRDYKATACPGAHAYAALPQMQPDRWTAPPLTRRNKPDMYPLEPTTAIVAGADRIQTALAAQGYDPGKIDSRPGPNTFAAIDRWRHDRQLPTGGPLYRYEAEHITADDIPPRHAAQIAEALDAALVKLNTATISLKTARDLIA